MNKNQTEAIDDFRYFLKRALDQKIERNPSYSLRAFSRDLGVSNQMLSQVMNGKIGLSLASAHDLAKKLKLSALESEIFTVLVQSKHGRTARLREEAVGKLEELMNLHAFKDVPAAQTEGVFEWYYLPVYVLAGLDDAQPNAEWYSKRLGITLAEAQQALSTLTAKGLLKRVNDGKFEPAAPFFGIQAEGPRDDVKQFYRVMLKKALESVDNDTQERDISVSVVVLAREKYDYAKNEIMKFRRRLIQEIGSEDSKDERLYSLSVQLFPLDTKSSKDRA